MYNRFIFKIDVSRTVHTIRPYWLSSCSHYPIIIDGVFIQISSVARFTGCCGENTPLARYDDYEYDDNVFPRLLREVYAYNTYIHTHTLIHICILQLCTSGTQEEYSSCLCDLGWYVHTLETRLCVIILMCAFLLSSFFNVHISPTTYPEKKILTENLDQFYRFPVRHEYLCV